MAAGEAGLAISDTAAMLAPYVVYGDTAAMLAPYVVYADTAAMLTTYVNVADTAAMLTTYVNNITASASEISTPLDGASVTLTEFQELETIGATTISANQWAAVGGMAETLTSTELDYVDGVTSGIQAQLGTKVDTTTLKTTAWLISDTIVLGAFSAIDSFNTSFIYGSFYNNGSDTLTVTEMAVSCLGTTVSYTVDVEWHATLGSGSATGLNTTPPTITDESGAITSDTSFDNEDIPPGVQVWVKTPTVTTAPTYMSVTLIGYRKNYSDSD